MPMYDYQCPACRSVTTRFRKVDTRHNGPQCECGEQMAIAILNAPFGRVQPEAHYVCPATGEHITSHRQRQNNFARHGLEPADQDQQKELMQRRMKKKKDRDQLAKEYLPKELKEQISKIGQNSDNPFVS